LEQIGAHKHLATPLRTEIVKKANDLQERKGEIKKLSTPMKKEIEEKAIAMENCIRLKASPRNIMKQS
jgi:hypothetical protein